MESFSLDGPGREVVLLRLPSGRLRYLLHVRREPCCHCSTGTRTVSLWATTVAYGEEVAWCRHCFNATCETIVLDPDQRGVYERVRAEIQQGAATSTWDAVRPALEDLERRGILTPDD